MLLSLCVNGRNRFHHCDQSINARGELFAEARPKSELLIMVGNNSDSPITCFISSENLNIFGLDRHLSIPFQSVLHFRVAFINSTNPAIISINGTSLRMGNLQFIRSKGVFAQKKLVYPSAFPADNLPHRPMIMTSSEIENRFFGLVDVSRYDLINSPSFPSGISNQKTDTKAGYVYVVYNPNFDNWLKVGSTVDLQKRISSYQTSDPLRRFEILRHYAVDDRRAVEQWILFRLKQRKLVVRNEWVEGNENYIVPIVEEEINTLLEV